MTSAFNHIMRTLAALALTLVALPLGGCSAQNVPDLAEEAPAAEVARENEAEQTPLASTAGEDAETAEEPAESAAAATSVGAPPVADALSFRDVAAYAGSPYVYVNDGEPAFTDEERAAAPGTEHYGDLDELGRCTATFAVVGTETMPTEERGSIGEVKPSGWQMAKYDFVDGKYLYNRCHLLGYQLTGENANTQNLITGTRYLNIEGMLPFENAVADYVDATGNHVLMRVTPVFEGSELVARGVHMMAESVEDGGDGVSFNVFCYNVQPGVVINYGTGENMAEEDATPLPDVSGAESSAAGSSAGAGATGGTSEKGAGDTASDTGKTAQDYVLNTNSKKFHVPGCSSVGQMKDKNRQDVNDTRENIIAQGYDPCKRCNP
ncbi:DNA/RNA non-specific endonuclease [uncultured Adlercreutzia sp.]|uniref:DNA/RNA non-specific endonuclease n=1 Tax=uncultured Adlercreutzia sp. TaxID=875803 RepID=UPI0026F3B67F|nr:DNA/RNA non-specific endonuclease [uncultured Adlercreutzia sp.]